jgi:acyl-coenzyme A synthetase/AMP-(fatty) acid ligase/acyl carrier protein
LLNGAALYPYRVQQEGVADLAAWLNQEAITLYFSIPVLFRQFVGSLSGQQRFPHLRIIQLGSDRVTRGELDLYKGHFSTDTVLIVRFGTTETGTLRRMFFEVTSPLDEGAVPVGYGIEDADISLLDQEGNDVTSGAIGEIVVKSRYISPGYWRRPDLTREVFFPDPNGGDKRTYHTGDLGRMRSDGLLYHLGRKDFQLKIRGYSVAAGEIEAVLQGQHNVKEAVVATDKPSAGSESDRLIAYVVPFETPPPSIHALRANVGKRLPAHMIPSDFIFVESLPRTPNGKIDRQALPEPAKARPVLDVAFVAPQTDLEVELAELWEEILDVRPIGVDDNFFDLGGDSLVAMRLISHVAKRFQAEIPLQFLFRSPTVAAMAAMCRREDGAQPADSWCG